LVVKQNLEVTNGYHFKVNEIYYCITSYFYLHASRYQANALLIDFLFRKASG
jgi:hypothetical protein